MCLFLMLALNVFLSELSSGQRQFKKLNVARCQLVKSIQ